MFAIVWAWINFSWFASAFDTDDWFYRVTTMVQMIGVVVLGPRTAPDVRVPGRGRADPQRGHGRRLLFVLADYTLYWVLARTFDPLHAWLVTGAVAVLAVAVVAAAAGAPMAWALLVVMLAPAVTVVGYETVGHRHVARMLAQG